MPPLPLTTLLHTALPHLTAQARAVVSVLAAFNGHAPPAGELAAMVGMHSRYQLARLLRREGLPPLEELAAWARVLYWKHETDARRGSLRELARRAGVDTATAYRVVRRVTGRRWSELQRTGLATALRQFRDRCTILRAAADAPRRAPTAAGLTPEIMESIERRPFERSPWRLPRHPTPVLTARLPVTGRPFDVVIGRNQTAYVTRASAASVDCVLLDPLRAGGSVPTGAVPTRLVLSQRGNRAYVTNQFTEDIGVIDLERSRQIGAIAVPGHPMAVVLSRDGRTLFVTTNLDQLYAIPLGAASAMACAPVPNACAEMALDPSGTRLYVPTWCAGTVLEVELPALRVTRTIRVGGKVQGLSVPRVGGTLFVANEDGWLDVIRLSTGARLARLDLGSPAFGVAVSPDDGAAYVSLPGAGRVVVVNPLTLGVVAVLQPGGTPRHIAFDASGRYALVANEAGWVDLVGRSDAVA